MEWIKLNKKKPRNDSRVLIFGKPLDQPSEFQNTQYVATYSDYLFYSLGREMSATHWMPLPEPPTK